MSSRGERYICHAKYVARTQCLSQYLGPELWEVAGEAACALGYSRQHPQQQLSGIEGDKANKQLQTVNGDIERTTTSCIADSEWRHRANGDIVHCRQ